MTVQVALWPRGLARVKNSGPLGIDWDGNDAFSGKPVFASEIGDLVSVAHSTRLEDGFGGDDLSSFKLQPNGGFIGAMFRPGDHVRITRGGGLVGDVELSEVTPAGDGTVDFACKGYGHNLDDYDSVAVLNDGDWSFPTTKLLKTILDDPTDLYGWEFAQSRGMPINQIVGEQGPMHLWTGELSAAEAPVKIRAVLTERYRPEALRWAVWGRSLVIFEEATTPKWAMDAPESLVGTADGEYFTDVGVEYIRADIPPDYDEATDYDAGDKVVFEGYWWLKLASGTGAGVAPGETFVPTWTTDEMVVWAPLNRPSNPTDWNIEWEIQGIDGINIFDTKTTVVDYRGRGPMTSFEAGSIAAGLLNQVKGRFLLSGSFTVTRDSGFKSAGGGDAGDALSAVKAGDGIQLNHLRSSQGNLIPGFQVIAKTDWSWNADEGGDGTESLTITPFGAVARNLPTILAGIPLANK